MDICGCKIEISSGTKTSTPNLLNLSLPADQFNYYKEYPNFPHLPSFLTLITCHTLFPWKQLMNLPPHISFYSSNLHRLWQDDWIFHRTWLACSSPLGVTDCTRGSLLSFHISQISTVCRRSDWVQIPQSLAFTELSNDGAMDTTNAVVEHIDVSMQAILQQAFTAIIVWLVGSLVQKKNDDQQWNEKWFPISYQSGQRTTMTTKADNHPCMRYGRVIESDRDRLVYPSEGM